MAEIDARQFLEWFGIWRNDGLNPLVTIKGYSDLLLKETVGELSDKQRQFIQIIARVCEGAIERWNYPSEYLRLRFEKHNLLIWEESSLNAMVEKALSQGEKTQNVKIELPTGLPTVRSNQWLQHALDILLHPIFDPSVDWFSNNRSYTLQARLKENKEISIQIKQGVAFHHSPQVEFAPGFPLSVVALIIQQHGSQLEIIPSASGTEFRFTLPIWQDPADSPPITNNQ